MKMKTEKEYGTVLGYKFGQNPYGTPPEDTFQLLSYI